MWKSPHSTWPRMWKFQKEALRAFFDIHLIKDMHTAATQDWHTRNKCWGHDCHHHCLPVPFTRHQILKSATGQQEEAFIWLMWITLAARIDSTNIKSKARQGWQPTETSCHVPVCDNWCCTWGLVVRWWLTSFSPCAITKSPYSVWVHTSQSWLVLKHNLGSNSQTLIECPCCDEFVGSSGSINKGKQKEECFRRCRVVIVIMTSSCGLLLPHLLYHSPETQHKDVSKQACPPTKMSTKVWDQCHDFPSCKLLWKVQRIVSPLTHH